MSLISNTVLAFSMSADAFAASLSKGVSLRKPKLREAMRIGAIFGMVEALTPLMGWLIGLAASRYIATIDHWVAFSILALIGGKMILEGLDDVHTARRDSHKLHVLILTATCTSMDAMAVGVTLALMDADIILTSLMIGGATFLMATTGIMTGHYIGSKAGKIAEIFAGICLIAIGTKILFAHLGTWS